MGDSIVTKSAALHSLFSGWGLPAFPAMSVPTSGDDVPDFPYLTYYAPLDSSLNTVACTVSIWYRSESWLAVNAKSDAISAWIGQGRVFPCDGGAILVRCGVPFSQQMGDDTDNMVKRRVLNLMLTFVTVY